MTATPHAAPPLVLGTRKGLLILESTAQGWRVTRECHLGANTPYAMVDHRTGTLWACLQHGHWGPKLARSRDLGANWEEVAAPQYPSDAEVKPGQPATLAYQWVLAPGADHEPHVLWMGTVPGGLFRSDDGGNHFELVRSLWDHPSRPDNWFGGGFDAAGIHSVLTDPRDARRVLVGVSCAGVFETRDGGATWSTLNRGLRADYLPNPQVDVGHDPHLVARCAAAPDVLWQQNHCGIFRSADGGANWVDITESDGPAKFGFAVAADAQSPEVAWVVPAESDAVRAAHGRALCVCRTGDGGQSWQALRDGLPQQDCFDLVFRHALDVRGDHLALGTSTGKVYVSHDRGDHWSPAALHLPPVYSVRFA